MRKRLTFIVIAIAAAAALVTPAAIAAPPSSGSTPVSIHETYTTYGFGRPISPPGTTLGTFEATAPLCPSGVIVDAYPQFRLVCDDGSGTFDHTFGYGKDYQRWRFAGGTGAYAKIFGGGDSISTNCYQPTLPCNTDLSGSVSL
jgi:hypothetical protein